MTDGSHFFDVKSRVAARVLDIHADAAGVKYSLRGLDHFISRVTVACLHVGTHGQRDRRGDAGQSFQHQGGGNVFSIRKSERRCNTGAGSADRGKSFLLENPGASRIPGVRQHQDTGPLVQVAEANGAGTLRFAVHRISLRCQRCRPARLAVVLVAARLAPGQLAAQLVDGHALHDHAAGAGHRCEEQSFAAEQRRFDSADELDIVVDRFIEGYVRIVICIVSPAFRLNSTKSPPAWMKTVPGPTSFSRMKPSPPKNPAPSFFMNVTLS